MDIGERLKHPDALNKSDSDAAEIIRKNLSALSLTGLSCKAIEEFAIAIIRVATNVHLALATIKECARTVGNIFDGTVDAVNKIRTLVDIAHNSPRDLLCYRHAGLKNADIGIVIEKASVALEHIKRERAILSETIYLDMVPSDSELAQTILTLREGDAWYRYSKRSGAERAVRIAFSIRAKQKKTVHSGSRNSKGF